MENIIQIIQQKVSKAVESLYNSSFEANNIPISNTRKEFVGDYTVVVFPFTKAARKKPEAIAEDIGQYLQDNVAEINSFNIVKGFLNLVIDDSYWTQLLLAIAKDKKHGGQPQNGEKVMVEFASPNTNKPLHLGHIRNILLGWSTSKILEAVGYDVVKVQIINDRGIAICKSMLAWQKYANGATPTSVTMKPDHFVGYYYVQFEHHFRQEYKDWQVTNEASTVYNDLKKEDQSSEVFFANYTKKYFNTYSQLGKEARGMLLAWEAGDEKTLELWKKMNGWVYAGMDVTYGNLGVHFDKLYYESNTYLLGKDLIEDGIKKGVFYKCDDGSVEIDLTSAKLNKKKVLRSDGTSIYVTQDLGTAHLRYQNFGVKKMVYVVANEQDHHFKVLFEIVKRLGEPYADGLFHLSYGMVNLPTGTMKTREGTVVDADDLLAEVIEEVKQNSEERDTLANLTKEEQDTVITQVGLAALKFFIIKVNPKKQMIFDPKESVDLQGQTGPYVQNAYVRIQSILRNAVGETLDKAGNYKQLEPGERDLIIQLFSLPTTIQEAAKDYDPSTIAQYAYLLAKTYHKFYHDHSILKADTPEARDFRLQLCKAVGSALEFTMDLLGIKMPQRM